MFVKLDIGHKKKKEEKHRKKKKQATIRTLRKSDFGAFSKVCVF
jgi:hypothetical protein